MRISMPKGDIKYIDFDLIDLGEYANIEFDDIYFTVKRSYKDEAFLFQKKLTGGGITKTGPTSYRIKINNSDTENLSVNEPNDHYDFDINIVYQDVIDERYYGELVITKSCTRNSNRGVAYGG